MFKKTERLNRTAFSGYFKIGRRFNSDNFTLIYSPAPVRAVAVVVGKKVFKGAVDRNTLRRRVYAAARTILDTQEVSTGIYIIIAKPTAKNCNQAAIVPEIESLLAMVVKPR
jgi:ribonuclease P protein component